MYGLGHIFFSSYNSGFHMLHNVFHTSLVILFLLITINLFKINDTYVMHNKLRYYFFDILSLTFDHFQDTKRIIILILKSKMIKK